MNHDKKESSKSDQWFSRYSLLKFWPPLAGALYPLNTLTAGRFSCFGTGLPCQNNWIACGFARA